MTRDGLIEFMDWLVAVGNGEQPKNLPENVASLGQLVKNDWIISNNRPLVLTESAIMFLRERGR